MRNITRISFKILDLLVIFIMVFGAPMSASAYTWTEPIDASPGTTVTIHGDNSDADNDHNFAPNEAVHVDVVGPNGGYTLACDAMADANGAWACDVTLLSDPALAVGEYTYTATGADSQNIETGTFTDSAGSYALKWYAADPAVNTGPFQPTYVKQPPSSLACPTPSAGTGRAADPLANAAEFASPAIPSNLDAVTSLEPKELALGQIVPYELEVTVSGSTSPENGIIRVEPYWLTKTTSGDDFGFDPAYGVYCAFVDTADPGTTDPGNNAKVASFSSTTDNVGTHNEQIHGIIGLSGLDNGDRVVVEIWVVLKSTIPTNPKPTGNVQTGLLAACVGTGTCNNQNNINIGNQTNPLNQVGQFFTASADVSIVKSDNPDPVVQGQQLTYSLVVTNNSTDTIANGIIVTDTLDPNVSFVSGSWPSGTCSAASGIVTCNVGALMQQQSVTITIVTTVSSTAPTNNDPSNNPETGTCTAAGPGIDLCNKVTFTMITTDPTPGNNSDSEPTNVLSSFVPNPHLSITKVATESGFSHVGDVIHYTIVATNDGNTNLASVTVTDPNASGLTCTPVNGSPLAPGASMNCTASHTITQADLNSGSYYNQACVDDGTGGAAQACDDVTTPGSQNPHLSITKVATESGFSHVGDVIHYTIVATNDGNTTLSSVTVTDSQVSDLNCTPSNGSSLAPGASITCTASHTVSQADIDAGSFYNQACVDDGAGGAAQACSDVTTPGSKNPHLSITKAATESGYSHVGDVIHYTIVATNDGNTTLASVTVTDLQVSNLNCTPANGSPLAPGASMNCTASHTITQADIDAGSFYNQACVDDGAGGAAEACDDVTTPGSQNPHLTISKVATESGFSHVGDVIHYTIVATNTGNVTLHNVTVTDDQVTDLNCTPANGSDLAPGASMNCSASHTITQADLDAGSFYNQACVDDGAGGAAQACDDTTTTGVQNPAISINKTTNGSDGVVVAVGSPITWTYLVTNTGNVTLTNVTVIDDSGTPGNPADDFSATCPKTTLVPGESMTCTAGGFAVAGHYVNTGTTTGNPPTGNPVTDTDESDYFSIPRLIVIKHVINNNGGTSVAASFTLDSGGTNDTPDNFAGSETGTTVTLDAGSYNVTETGPGGYSASYSANCSGTIANGETKTCTVTNDDIAPSLTLNKIVVNNNGGTAAESAWTLTANGGTAGTLSGPGAAGNADVVSDSTFKAGTYALSESTGPSGYTASAWSCVKNGGAPASGSSITLGLSDSATCTITNDDQPGTLIVKKVVINDNGGTKIATNFSFQVNGGSAVTFQQDTDALHGKNTLTVNAGTYDVTEPVVGGYATTYSYCSNITVANGATQTCTVTNNDIAPSLTLNKIVVNDNGGTAAESAWTLTANGGTAGTLSGPGAAGNADVVSGSTFKAGTYALSESAGPSGYSASAWTCVKNGGAPVSGSSITLGLGDSATCTITNNDQPGTIIIQKIVKGTNLNTSFSFTTTGTGYTNFSLAGGQTNTQTPLNAGTYTVKELVPLGWVLTGIGFDPVIDVNFPYNCKVTGSGGSTGVGDLNTQTATISLKNGDTVTCVFENTGPGVTRTQGFWATHPQLAQIAWFGGTGFGHTFPGVAGVSGIGDKTLCGRPIDTLGKLMGAFWSDVSKTTTGAKRSNLDQSRMQLLQQLIAAELNASAFGSVPSSGSFAAWESAYCGSSQSAINTAQQQSASFNSQGDNSTFTPGTSADSKNARAVANYTFWDVLP